MPTYKVNIQPVLMNRRHNGRIRDCDLIFTAKNDEEAEDAINEFIWNLKFLSIQSFNAGQLYRIG